MGGGNPLKKLKRETEKYAREATGYETAKKAMQTDVGRDIGSVLTMGTTEGSREREERQKAEVAQAEQETILEEQKAEATKELDERKKRMLKSRQGRRSLLSGSVKGASDRQIMQ